MALTLPLLMSGLACSAPKAELADSPLATTLQAPAGSQRFSHDAFASVLSAAVDLAAGRVDYDAVELNRAELDAYTSALGTADLAALAGDERKALLINAYNAFTLKLIVEQPTRPDSIRELKDPWGTRRWLLAGQTVSLDDIEHGLLRPVFKDPRLHFALNCASVGCPPLRATPFEGPELDDQLDTATRDALARPLHLRVEDSDLKASKLLDWYGDDFTAQGWDPIAPSRPEWLARYSPPQVQALVAAHGADTPLGFIPYDWDLNGVSR